MIAVFGFSVGTMGALGGALIGAVGLWTHYVPGVGGIVGLLLGAIWFGAGLFILFEDVEGEKHMPKWTGVVSSGVLAMMGAGLAANVGWQGSPGEGALWLGLGSLSMGCLIGVVFGLSPKSEAKK